MNAKGFTLVEGLVALGILGVVLAGIVPSFFTYVDVNRRNEERAGAVAVAQQVLESMRRGDPSLLPASGTAIEIVSLDGREYEVATRYCVLSGYCGTHSRHILIEVHFGGRKVYEVESVFTRLR